MGSALRSPTRMIGRPDQQTVGSQSTEVIIESGSLSGPLIPIHHHHHPHRTTQTEESSEGKSRKGEGCSMQANRRENRFAKLSGNIARSGRDQSMLSNSQGVGQPPKLRNSTLMLAGQVSKGWDGGPDQYTMFRARDPDAAEPQLAHPPVS